MISVRQMTGEDIAVSQELLTQLGYPLDTPEVQRRYDAVAALTGCGKRACQTGVDLIL
jgi:hypothetical protein